MNYPSYQPQDYNQPPERNSSGKTILVGFLILVLVVSAGIGGALAGGFIVYQTLQSELAQAKISTQPVNANLQQANPVSRQLEPITFSSTEIQTTITKVVEQVGPAVVTVITTIPDQRSGWRIIRGGTSSGSGVIISPIGYILTNNHVVNGGSEYKVILANGVEKIAKLMGTDAFTDLAVLRVEGDLPGVANLGNSNTLKRGETVIAIGSPLGDFKNSVTVGVVSATGRSLDTGDGFLIDGLIQTDAAINQGNSGGPLINLAGQVIGINTMIVRGNASSSTVVEGLGFAVPSTTAQLVANHIIEKGFVSRPYVGVITQAIDPSLARRYNLPVEWGAYITEIANGSPAQRVGLKPGDIIIQVGDITLDEQRLFLNALFNYAPGQTIKISVMRGSQKLEVNITLDATSK